MNKPGRENEQAKYQMDRYCISDGNIPDSIFYFSGDGISVVYVVEGMFGNSISLVFQPGDCIYHRPISVSYTA